MRLPGEALGSHPQLTGRGMDTPVTLDLLAGEWRIFQLRDGHRFSVDDLLTAWTAAEARPQAKNLLDLGAGIGSVGLLTLWRMGAQACLTLLEVQALSHALARRTLAHNGLGERVRLLQGDLREWPGGEYDLITGSPPYLPLGRGTLSGHPQKAAARFELHGDVFDYCQAASRSLTPAGLFCFCHSASDPRPAHAVKRAGLCVTGRREVRFRAHRPPSIALYTCARQGEWRDQTPLSIRGRDGRWTEEYLTIREQMGTPRSLIREDRAPPADHQPAEGPRS